MLGRWQATERDDYRDAEPGKIMHELRTGELAHFKLIPHTPYYGTADATPLYLIVLHNAWRCTGDRELIERHLATAERCLAWIDKYGDRDGDGFQEYQTRSPDGYENQGWKDAGEALVYPDGSLVKGPKALCELQGYVYDAWLRMAEIYDALGEPRTRRGAARQGARALRAFNEAFWDEESGFYAFCLDGDKKPVLSVASNPGHLPVVRHRAARARRAGGQAADGAGHVERLGHPHAVVRPSGLQSALLPERLGLAARQRPDRAGLSPLRLRRRGDAGGARRERRGQLLHPAPDAGALRRPAAHRASFPVQYQGANVPQAWAAGSCFASCRRCSASTPTRPTIASTSIPPCPAGCRT